MIVMNMIKIVTYHFYSRTRKHFMKGLGSSQLYTSIFNQTGMQIINTFAIFQFSPKVDPCDPTLSKNVPSFPRVQQQGGENRTPGRSKANKTKGKGRKAQEDDRPTAPVRKLWYEALSPEGYTYYWHIETNGTYIFVKFCFIFLPVCLLNI